MGFNRHGRYEELFGNFCIAVAFDYQLKDLLFSVGQLVAGEKTLCRPGGGGELLFEIEVVDHNVGELHTTETAVEQGKEEGTVGQVEKVNIVVYEKGDEDYNCRHGKAILIFFLTIAFFCRPVDLHNKSVEVDYDVYSLSNKVG